MLPKGRRDQRVTFERAAIERGELGAKRAPVWAQIGTPRWAAVFGGSGAERRSAAGVEQAVQTATFNVLPDSLTLALTVKDRVLWNGLAWDIAGIFPVGHGPREIEITCLASRG